MFSGGTFKFLFKYSPTTMFFVGTIPLIADIIILFLIFKFIRSIVSTKYTEGTANIKMSDFSATSFISDVIFNFFKSNFVLERYFGLCLCFFMCLTLSLFLIHQLI